MAPFAAIVVSLSQNDGLGMDTHLGTGRRQGERQRSLRPATPFQEATGLVLWFSYETSKTSDVLMWVKVTDIRSTTAPVQLLQYQCPNRRLKVQLLV